MTITTKIAGEAGTPTFRVYFLNGEAVVSPFHDVPLWVNEKAAVANMLVEIPRGTNAKMEISTKELMNPIKQDVKDGKLRFVHDKYPFNYGALPQTWENPHHVHPDTGAKGDNDPLDACEIGSALGAQGEFKQVKILGVWAMIDAGETDWKILCIDTKDPVADQINTIEDVERVLPGKINEVFTFLRDYKIPDGKGPNNFAFDGKLLDKEFAIKITNETNQEWKQLVSGNTESPLAIESTLTEGVKKSVCGKETKSKLSL
ncbi:inorganic pyrophosphatase [Heterostelium album PN500]|uniref:inorganic diphosphatase n=1 Tax=Heterostelium pallidum (strain ATCC 26659 / Pp 5 / PN500) TaxID=670386 RepID=D3B3C1_HETP5|nr:inorganic pyrophosphatase [Heterostelium album PN500]EFA83819.1 inorganic pyrophosphatase [Heterostelium album PN500]|eukprot:XP_020435936.1 inorganic pyrophosphatase [Heterostelium album PN500]